MAIRIVSDSLVAGRSKDDSMNLQSPWVAVRLLSLFAASLDNGQPGFTQPYNFFQRVLTGDKRMGGRQYEEKLEYATSTSLI